MTIKEYVTKRKEELKDLVSSMAEKPHLKIIQMNEDAGSNAYVRGKLKDAAELGVEAELIKLPLDTTEEEMLTLIDKINHDDSCDGFIVQMPLMKHIDEEKVKRAVIPSKDIDGFNPLSEFISCTPGGIIRYLKHENFPFDGKNATVIGRSNIVGKPLAHLLLKENMNVTVLHSHTSFEDMNNYIKNSDLVCVAIGRRGFIDNKFTFKDSAYVIDVGINRCEDGLHGDCVENLPVSFQSPVPRGVGLLTRLALMENLIIAKEKKNGF